METLPATLFKYLPESRIDFFNRPMLRFTPVQELNDPFEASFVYTQVENPQGLATEFVNAILGNASSLSKFWEMPIELRRKVAEPLIQQEPDYAEFIDAVIADRNSFESQIASIYLQDAENQEIIRDTLGGMLSSTIFTETTKKVFDFLDHGILSLSEDPKSILMWSHYSSNHKGLVVGLDVGNEFLFNRTSSLYKEPRLIKKVSYLSNRPKGIFSLNECNLQQVHEFSWYRKNNCWEYEKEWRILEAYVSKMPTCKKNIIGLELIQIKAIKSIHLGLRASDAMKSAAIDFIVQNPSVQLYQAAMHELNYAVEFTQILPSR